MTRRAAGKAQTEAGLSSPQSATSWQRELWARVRHGWWVKMIATTAGISLFFVAYFWVLHHPQFALTVVPLSWLDQAIPFEPAALPVYFSLWLYVSLAPALQKDLRGLATFGLASSLLSIAGLAIFLLWPTTIPSFDIDWTQHPSIEFLKNVDVASNACPSMHVAFAVFTAIWLHRVLVDIDAPRSLFWLNGIWSLAISWSTIATRQHVAYDVLAGAVLGALFALPQLHMPRRGRQAAAKPV